MRILKTFYFVPKRVHLGETIALYLINGGRAIDLLTVFKYRHKQLSGREIGQGFGFSDGIGIKYCKRLIRFNDFVVDTDLVC